MKEQLSLLLLFFYIMNYNTTVKIDSSMLVPWHKRLLNLLIDVAVLILIFIAIGFIGVITSFLGSDAILIWFEQIDGLTDRIVTTLVMSAYLFISEFLTQKSIGKMITGTMVVMQDGSKPTAKAILIRALCRIISLEALSFIAKIPRGWHDTASNTYVVDAKKYKAALEIKNSFEEIGSTQLQ
ncbi:RDD family protein [Flavobacterium sp. MFBS3-15]|uniref:RDD family protein n=1 Tax=Flavobacterium sp. MFBS3-15 TaxID=2989816 RepID=UPI002235A7C8|nr:RDD family protein [Flavobacterium sp. MFBS3-15]MCW4468102.1 RDD family protein [Flavobacterium sp. MFBS3-15]